jgi:hypothetical protein
MSDADARFVARVRKIRRDFESNWARRRDLTWVARHYGAVCASELPTYIKHWAVWLALERETDAAGPVAVVKRARELGCGWSRDLFPYAIGRGWLDLAKWAHGEGCPSDRFAAATAAKRGDLKALQWMYEVGGFKFDHRSCSSAAAYGQLEALIWLREVARCPWSRWVVIESAKRGHMHVLQWALEHGAPYDSTVWAALNERGDLAALAWVEQWLEKML